MWEWGKGSEALASTLRKIVAFSVNEAFGDSRGTGVFWLTPCKLDIIRLQV
jgi:hypothetical protein